MQSGQCFTGLPLRGEQGSLMGVGGGLQLLDGLVALLLEPLFNCCAGRNKPLQLGLMLPFQRGELTGLPPDGAVELAFDKQQPVTLLSERADCAGLIFELAFDLAQPLLEGLHLGQDRGGGCKQQAKLNEKSARQWPDMGDRQELTFQLGDLGIMHLLVAHHAGNPFLEGTKSRQQPVEDDLTTLAHALQKDKKQLEDNREDPA